MAAKSKPPKGVETLLHKEDKRTNVPTGSADHVLFTTSNTDRSAVAEFTGVFGKARVVGEAASDSRIQQRADHTKMKPASRKQP